MACLFGHKWNGCKCEKCAKTRDEGHDWDLCKGVCRRCGKKRDEQHDWDGCVCRRCGKKRDEQHDWDVCTCKRCGKVSEERHDWDGCKCRHCGKVSEERHDWDACKCRRCGKMRATGHDYIPVPAECIEKCRVCGQENFLEHPYVPGPGACEKTCSRCGRTIEEHEFVDGKCVRCGASNPEAVLDECLAQLLAIFPRTPLTPSGHVEFDKLHLSEVRVIGKKLDERGGMHYMRRVGEAFAKELPLHARKLETMWNGIGSWLG